MKIKKISLTMALTLAGIVATFSPAMAACIISTTPVIFGIYDVFATGPLDSTGTVTYDCKGKIAPTITITLDRGGAPTFNPRQMLKGTEALNYNLYLNAAGTRIWGDGTGGTEVCSDPCLDSTAKKSVTVTIYGRIPAAQDVSAGIYTNTVAVTINF